MDSVSLVFHEKNEQEEAKWASTELDLYNTGKSFNLEYMPKKCHQEQDCIAAKRINSIKVVAIGLLAQVNKWLSATRCNSRINSWE